MAKFLLSSFTSLLFIITATSGAPSTELTYNANGETIKVSDESITKIRQVVEKEVLSHVVKAYLGVAPEYAAASCKQIAEQKPHYDSGYCWIQGRSGPVGVYCDMEPQKFEQTGGWMRIANVDMRYNQTQCPIGLRYNVTENKPNCRRYSRAPGCTSVFFPSHGVRYSRVCGKVIGYQYYQPNGFGPARYTPGINETYVDGVSITHGSPRQHVWTFAAGFQQCFSSCPCIDRSCSFTGVIPPFVGNDYYCETGNRAVGQRRYYLDDPLWDGEGCTGQNNCCDRGGPWFCKDLTRETRDDIELRVCTNNLDQNEDVLLEQIKLFVR